MFFFGLYLSYFMIAIFYVAYAWSGNTNSEYANLLEALINQDSAESSDIALLKTINGNEELSLENHSSSYLLKHASLLFSPGLTPEDWYSQLEVLKNNKAKLGDVEMTRFNKVELVELNSISEVYVDRFCGKKSDDLLVVYGKCMRSMHLQISRGCTVVGSEALVTVGDKIFRLNTPKAVISANPKQFIYRRENGWLAQCYKTGKVFTDAVKIKCGHVPCVYMRGSNLMGVTIKCNGITQAIVGSSEEIIVSDLIVEDPLNAGIFLHDCSKAVTERIKLLYPDVGNEKNIGIEFRNCDDINKSNCIKEHCSNIKREWLLFTEYDYLKVSDKIKIYFSEDEKKQLVNFKTEKDLDKIIPNRYEELSKKTNISVFTLKKIIASIFFLDK